MKLAPLILRAFLVLPVGLGLLITLGQGATSLSVLLDWPGLARACLLSLGPGLGATLISLALVGLILGADPRSIGLLERLLAPLLALPHASAALGLAFLIAPSGWIARAISPWATGWLSPPDLMTLNDPWGMALTLGLVVKETPFLLLMALAAMTPALRHRQRVAATLGYGRGIGFALVVWPSLYPALRLPVLAVLAYGMTTVDMAMILGPSLPYSLSAQISLWRSAASLTHQDQAAAAALLQAGLVGAALILWRGVEAAASALRQRMTLNGIRAPWAERIFTRLATAAVVGLIVLPLLGLLGLGLWSVAGLWRFPEALPNQITLQAWASAGPALLDASATSVALALAVTAVALALTLWALQAEALPPSPRRDGLIFLPLIVPQIVVLPGIATALLHLPMPPFVAVALGHLIYVLPYVVLGLSGPFRGWNPQLGAVGASLGAKPWRVLLHLRLPMLAGPIAATAAVGFAVSIGQYLPTLLLGGGRIVTLTTEAVALSSGGNRRIVGAYGLAQAFWPALAFVLATQIQRARSLSFGPHPR